MQEKGLFEEVPLTVSQFLDSVNFMLTTGRPVVLGEVSEFRVTNKWVSFSLQDKEDRAILKCVITVWDFKRIGVEIADGMEVKVSGTARITKAYGSLALWVDRIEPVGEGSLKKAYQLLLKRLEFEGLYARKRGLPSFISNIGIISSRDGVVIHDFKNNLRKFGINLNFMNSKVEGKDAVGQITNAISWFNMKMPELDTLVIIRGGGSLESMQAFNNETVCREIFASKIPIIAGIGHDVDVPIACLVADISVSTPTAVANIINQSWDELIFGLPRLEHKILNEFGSKLRIADDRAIGYISNMIGRLRIVFANFELLANRITRDGPRLISESIKSRVDLINRIEKIINIANPERSLRLGYSLTLDVSKKLVRRIGDVEIGSKIKTILADGEFESIIDKI